MIPNEEVLPILIKETLQSFVSDGATSGRDPTNHCLHGPGLQMCNAERGYLHTVTQLAKGHGYSLGLTFGTLSTLLFNRQWLKQAMEGIFVPSAQISSPFINELQASRTKAPVDLIFFFFNILETVRRPMNKLGAVSSLQQRSAHVDSPLKQKPLWWVRMWGDVWRTPGFV